MMRDYDNFRQAYPDLLELILRVGEKVAPRGLQTKEILGASFSVRDATDMLAVKTGRKLNVSFAAGDALSVIGGFSDHEWLAKWNPRIAQYGEHGAYGPRLVGQLYDAMGRLHFDELSRRAVMTIWSPELDGAYGEGFTDYPCTVSCQLMIRKGALDMHVSMRANDAWFGLPYDVFTFSQLQCTIANLMHRPIGAYYHHATSLHLYEKDWEAAMEVVNTVPTLRPPEFRPVGIDGINGGGWIRVAGVAHCIKEGHVDHLPPVEEAPSTHWYKEKLS